MFMKLNSVAQLRSHDQATVRPLRKLSRLGPVCMGYEPICMVSCRRLGFQEDVIAFGR